jgi:hypothetical protein
MTDQEYVPDIDEADQIITEQLQTSTRNECKDGAPFLSLVKLAFPETKDEWAIVGRRAGKKAAAKKAARKKMAAKKASARKMAAKKSARKR